VKSRGRVSAGTHSPPSESNQRQRKESIPGWIVWFVEHADRLPHLRLASGALAGVSSPIHEQELVERLVMSTAVRMVDLVALGYHAGCGSALNQQSPLRDDGQRRQPAAHRKDQPHYIGNPRVEGLPVTAE